MTKELTLENLISLIKKFHGISDKKLINENTLIEDELGITGDDGCELLEEIETQFKLSFTGKDGSFRALFELEENQYLFHSEGFNPMGIFPCIFGRKTENVKPISVGELYSGALMAKSGNANG